MQISYKERLTDNHWTKKLNENLTAKIQTKYGLTKMIKIRYKKIVNIGIHKAKSN